MKTVATYEEEYIEKRKRYANNINNFKSDCQLYLRIKKYFI